MSNSRPPSPPAAAGGTAPLRGRAAGRRWFDSVMPSTPRSARRLASARELHALDDNLALPLVADPGEVLVGDGRVVETLRSRSSPTVPDQRSREANARGSVVRKSNHHHGRGIAFTIVFAPSCSGRSRSACRGGGRRPRVRPPSRAACRTRPPGRGRPAPWTSTRSFHMYSWNQFRPCGLASRTSSMAVVPIVEGERDAGATGRAGSGALALGLHHPGEARRCDAERVRDVPAEDLPRRVDRRDVAEDRGRANSMSSNACRARAREISAWAAPSV